MMVEKPWDSLSLFDSDGTDFWDRVATNFDSSVSVPIPPVKAESGTSPTAQLIPKCAQPDGEEEVCAYEQAQPPTSPRVHKREPLNEFDAYDRHRQQDADDDQHHDDGLVEEDHLDEYASELLSALQPNPYAAVRRMRRRMLRIPVLPKSDIRRYYLNMFTNAINSHDASFLKQFLTTYCQPTVTLQRIGDCKFHHGGVPQQPPPLTTPCHSFESYRKLLTTTANKSEFMKRQFHLKRVQEIFAFWAVKYDLHPDHMCRFQEMRVITTRASDYVRLEGHFTVTKTDIYEITPPIMHSLFTSKIQEHMSDGPGGGAGEVQWPANHWPGCSCGRAHGTNPAHRTAEEREAMDQLLSAGHKCEVTSLPLSREPMQCVLEGNFVLIIGPDKRIEQIQLLPHQVQFKPVPPPL
eukprot:gene4701-3367_t